MIALKPPVHQRVIPQLGTVRYLAHKEIQAPWIPLSGALLDPAVYPGLFKLLGYREGRGTGNQANFFKLPTVNGADAGSKTSPRRAKFLRIYNELKAGSRNKYAIAQQVANSFVQHSHSGSVSSAGNHSHNFSGSWLSNNGIPGQHNKPPLQDDQGFTPTTFYFGHDYHSHGIGSTSGTSTQAAANLSDGSEPLSMSVVACIYAG